MYDSNKNFRYFVQVTAIKSADISGRQDYRLELKDLSFSPQCVGLGVPASLASPSCKRSDMEWRHDMDDKEIAACMGQYTLEMSLMYYADYFEYVL